MRMMMMVMAVVSCEGDDDGVDSHDDGVEMGRGGEVVVVERAAVRMVSIQQRTAFLCQWKLSGLPDLTQQIGRYRGVK
ncbi:hypothetical protein Tco_0679131 [Tanacetum coccineum]|uniref:Secreted protein n=1 Tax=Tanacetum coccineum TaxID=301880 RepID=A0ABQ4XHN5_9ASTR